MLCDECGQEIPPDRLTKRPWTRYCERCALEVGGPDVPKPWPTPPKRQAVCPCCGSPTIVRENRADGSEFIGCTSFPRCRWTANLS